MTQIQIIMRRDDINKSDITHILFPLCKLPKIIGDDKESLEQNEYPST